MVFESLILYTALALHQDCASTFRDAALLVNPNAIEERDKLVEFSEIACATDNPDVIWQIAYAESSFRFDMIAINGKDGQPARVLVGEAASRYLQGLASAAKKGAKRPNVDVGVMQMNWRVHGDAYGLDATAILSPKSQVKYLVDRMVPDLVPSCGKRWVGCYHSWNRTNQRKYIKRILRAERQMKQHLAEVLVLRGREKGLTVSLAGGPLDGALNVSSSTPGSGKRRQWGSAAGSKTSLFVQVFSNTGRLLPGRQNKSDVKRKSDRVRAYSE